MANKTRIESVDGAAFAVSGSSRLDPYASPGGICFPHVEREGHRKPAWQRRPARSKGEAAALAPPPMMCVSSTATDVQPETTSHRRRTAGRKFARMHLKASFYSDSTLLVLLLLHDGVVWSYWTAREKKNDCRPPVRQISIVGDTSDVAAAHRCMLSHT